MGLPLLYLLRYHIGEVLFLYLADPKLRGYSSRHDILGGPSADSLRAAHHSRLTSSRDFTSLIHERNAHTHFAPANVNV